jgi:hypothetical protein
MIDDSEQILSDVNTQIALRAKLKEADKQRAMQLLLNLQQYTRPPSEVISTSIGRVCDE